MIYILHGENIVASRNEMQRIQKEFNGGITNLDAKEVSLDLLSQHFQSNSFFEQGKKLIILENSFSVKNLIEDLPSLQENADLILWEAKKLSPSQISSLEKRLGKTKTLEFKIDPIVFKFVESIAPGSQKIMLPLWQQYISQQEPEIILTMIARQFRLLLLVKNKSTTGPDEYNRLAPWQKSRLDSQANLFTDDQLKELYEKLLEIDFENKSSTSLTNLTASIELLLLNL